MSATRVEWPVASMRRFLTENSPSQGEPAGLGATPVLAVVG
jgi:hypothetical protein